MRETQTPDAQLMQKKHKKEGKEGVLTDSKRRRHSALVFFSAHLMTNTALTTNFASFNTKSLSSLGFFFAFISLFARDLKY